MQPNFDAILNPNRTLNELHRHLDSTLECFNAKDQPDLIHLNESIHSLAMTLKTLIEDFQTRQITNEQYNVVREKLKLLNDNYSRRHPSIKAIYDAAEKGLIIPRSGSPVNLLYQAASWAAGYLPQSFQNQFFDVNHPWKQKKYELALQLIVEASQRCRKDIFTVYSQLECVTDFEQPLREPTLQLLRTLLVPVLISDQFRDQSQFFLNRLREILTSRIFEIEANKKIEQEKPLLTDVGTYDNCVDELLWLCWFRFTEVHLFPFCKNVVELMVAKGKANLQNVQLDRKITLLSDLIEDDFYNIKSAPLQAPKLHTNTQKLKGTLNIGFDPHGSSNIPYVLYSLDYATGAEASKKVTALRIGTPTRQRFDGKSMTYQGEAEIVPEFEKFIFMLKWIMKKKILDISLQEDVERTVCTESERSRALRELHQKYPETFLLIILSQDSDFYYQRGLYATLDNANDFKRVFLHEMTSPFKKGFFFPSVWKEDPNFEKELTRLLDVVHRDVFANAVNLTIGQRQDFIEIYYARLAMYAIKYSGVDYFFMCCKDSADRAPKVNAVFFYLMMLIMRKEKDPAYIEIFRVNIHAAAMLVKKQVMDHGRRIRLLSALRQLERPEVQENIRNWAADFPILGDIVVEKPKGQEV